MFVEVKAGVSRVLMYVSHIPEFRAIEYQKRHLAGAITWLHLLHGNITWKLDAGVYLGVCWICSERRSSQFLIFCLPRVSRICQATGTKVLESELQKLLACSRASHLQVELGLRDLGNLI